jgi:hypothetical protein
MRPITLLLAVAALCACAAASAGAASKRYVAADCRHLSTRPATIIVACGDGAVQLFGLSWSSFGTAARGRGVLSYRTCNPSCATGGVKKVSGVGVTLSGARPCRNAGGRLVFRRARITYPGRRPSGAPSGTLPLGCPI